MLNVNCQLTAGLLWLTVCAKYMCKNLKNIVQIPKKNECVLQ